MDLFKLVGTIAINNQEANKAIDGTTDKAQKSHSILSGAFSKIGNAAVKVGTYVASGMAVASTAVGGLVTKSVQSYAEYEQLVGGVETLFKGSANKVIEYADNAYKTAGLSANDYMSTVTSFSASLLQSLDGDTAKASEYAHKAIVDMSDNANKMGTDISMIQNAYQGFAKQNYTMLDNLKLGYGGTKEEMARLLADAEKLSGKKFNMSSYADIIEAIHVIQTEIGITGTTQLEAEKTISGSLSMTKAAWSNLLTGMADDNADFEGLVKNFVDSIGVFASNIVPRIKIALDGVIQLVSSLGGKILPMIPPMLETLIPAVVEGATSLANSVVKILPSLMKTLGSALMDALPLLMGFVGNMLSGIANFIQTNLPIITSKAKDMVGGLGEKIKENLPILISKGLDILLGLSESILKNIPMLVSTGMELIKSLVVGLVKSLPDLLAKAPTIISNFANTISNSMGTIFTKGLEIIWELIKGIIGAIPDLIKNIPKIIKAIFDVWNAVNWLNLGKNLINGISKGIKNMGGSLKNTASNLFTKLKNSTVNIFKSIGNGIMHPINSAKSLFSSAVTGIKNFAVNGFNSLRSRASSIFNNIKTAITNPIQTAKNTIKGIVDTIKSFFTNLKIKFPPIKLPHFKISGEFSLDPPSVPKFSIEWYKKAMNAPMLLNDPTIFGYNPATGQMRGAGEAGEEVVSGASALMRMIKGAVNSELDGVAYYLQQLISMLAEYFPELIASAGHDVVLNDGVLVGRLAPAMDLELGKISRKKGRGR